jgi:putative transposase
LRETEETRGKYRVARLMRANKIRAVRGYSRKPKSGAKLSNSLRMFCSAQFDFGRPKAWATDIT